MQHRQWWPNSDVRQAINPTLGGPYSHEGAPNAHACIPSVSESDDLGLAWTESTIMADIRAAPIPAEAEPPAIQPLSSQPETLAFIGIFLSGVHDSVPMQVE